MSRKEGKKTGKALVVKKEEFNLYSHDDFLRVDTLCKDLLLNFYEQLQEEGLTPEEATVLANGADYYARNFVVDFKAFNLFDELPGLVRQFAGNWFISNTLEPEIGQLDRLLRGVRAFYEFLHGHGLISQGYMQTVDKECGDLAFYENRIASFWEIKGDGYSAWEKECSLKEGGDKHGRA